MPKFIALAVDSVRNPNFGEQIADRKVSAAITYFIKFQLLASLLPFIFSLFALAYFVPQLPKLARENLPDQTIAVSDGQLKVDKDIFVSNPEFALVVSPEATASQLDSSKTGILANKDTLFIKSETGQNQIPLSIFNGLSLSKEGTSQWLAQHTGQLFAGGAALLLALALISGLLGGLFRFALLALWSIGFSFIKKTIPFETALKYSLFASVIGMVVSFVLQFLSPSIAALAWVADIAITLYLFFKWINRSPTPRVASVVASPTKVTPKKSRKTSSR